MARQSRTPILLTRPQPQSERFMAELRAAGVGNLDPVIAPLIVPEGLLTQLPPGPFAGVIFSSETGVRMAAPFRESLPDLAFCVGDRTAAAASAAGFRACSAQGDARDLIALVQRSAPVGRLLHLHGQDTRGAVAETLKSAGIETVSALAYRQNPAPLTGAAITLLRGEVAVILPLFSPRTAGLFGQAYRQIGGKAPLDVVAMSPAVAGGIDLADTRRVMTADSPDAAAMVRAIGALIDAPSSG